MKRTFKLLDVLGFTTGICLSDDFGKIMDVYGFMVKKDNISMLEMVAMSDARYDEIKQNIYRQHPYIFEIGNPPSSEATTADFDAWCQAQVDMFGENVTLTPMEDTEG